jgi:argininosuccinate lyase
MAGMICDMKANKENMESATQRGYLTATDLADWLVIKTNLPFRQAHHVTGRLVRLAEEKKCRLDELSLAEMKKIEPKLTKEIFAVLSPARAIHSRKSYGGTAPDCVKAQIKRWHSILGKK